MLIYQGNSKDLHVIGMFSMNHYTLAFYQTNSKIKIKEKNEHKK